MKITAYWPLIEIAAFGSVFKILRYWDRGWTSDKLKSKLPSIQTYIDLHAGPEFAIHWRYSAVLFQLSVALFFGTGIPILYQYQLGIESCRRVISNKHDRRLNIARRLHYQSLEYSY